MAGVVVAALAGAWFVHARREAARLAEADRARAEEIRAESRASREGDTEERTGQLNARVDAAIAQLQSASPMTRCEGALQLGRIGTGAQIGVLTDLVYNYSESTECADLRGGRTAADGRDDCRARRVRVLGAGHGQRSAPVGDHGVR